MKKLTFLILFLLAFNGLNAQIVNIPDANFKAKLLEADTSNFIATDINDNYIKIDINGNLEIEVSEANLVYNLYLTSSSISNLEGITSFSNLKNLNSSYNSLTFLNLSGLNNLQSIICFENQLTSLDLSGVINIKEIDCSYNPLSNLNLTGLTQINRLLCNYNHLSSLNLTALINLTYLECSHNNLTTLDLSGLSVLQSIGCANNPLVSVNLTGLKNATELILYGNELTNLDLTGLDSLVFFNTDNSLFLKSIIIKNNASYSSSLSFSNCPNLEFVCADDSKINMVQNLITTYSYTNCHVNSYCTFVPGGTFYKVQGNMRYDLNINGCDTSDTPTGNSKFDINNGTNSISQITNGTGSYTIALQAGTYTINPFPECPNYFTFFPSTINVTFPTQVSPFIQDICITPIGIHPDLEISLLPINPARPGFDADYKIIYKNKGNQIQSGTVNLNFNDTVLDFINANPTTSNQAINTLTWNFVNLSPFETREITLTFNLNGPTETPSINIGDQLNFNSVVNPIPGDETPNDNTSYLIQTVVGAYDPNDKTCIEGTTITPAMVGEYVHYIIRFENTGTFPAENIVVKDIIDTAKFDINTLVPIKGSAEFVTKISNTNKVEFIFEGINLPFDDANNDGFIAFKIKTKSTLVLGDTFSNSANIYFDYNFPIVTNTATTTVQTLGTTDFDFAKYFKVYPNPAFSSLNLATQSGITVNAISIYNMLGQLVIAIPNAQTVSTIDVSSLKIGNYFIKVSTDKGTSNTKFIKN